MRDVSCIGSILQLQTDGVLADEQVNRLRDIARQATARLRESNRGEDETGGSTNTATARATEQIRGALGAEKAGQLFALVRERWAGGGSEGGAGPTAGPLPDKPNSIPTDTRIVVNAPAYRMDVFENGQLVKSYKVAIGYPEFPLPTGQRTAKTIIFNPTWTPPDEPWVEGSSKVQAGQMVAAGSKLNPLGPIKIPIGLPSLIHGGKAPAKLGTFGSHGCVGLTSPQVQDFALELAKLGGANLTEEDVTAYERQKTETKNVPLDRPVPVELRYETIVVEAGKLHVYRDVYDRGTNTEEHLRAVLQTYGVAPADLTEPERAQVTAALDQMARDAQGHPAEGNGNANESAGSANANNANAANANDKTAKQQNDNASGKVTRTIKGKKEIVIEIAALKGKGYPAPVNMNTSGAKQAAAPARRKRA